MSSQELFERYIELCARSLSGNERVQKTLKHRGITDTRIIASLCIGYADGSMLELTDGQEYLSAHLERIGILDHRKERLRNRLTFPILDAAGGIANIVGYSLSANEKQRTVALNETGVFNAPHLQHAENVALCDDPLHALLLIQAGITGTTFVFGDDGKHVKFFQEDGIRQVTFTCEGRARLYHQLGSAGISTRRIVLDFDRIISGQINRGDLQAKLFEERETKSEIDQSEKRSRTMTRLLTPWTCTSIGFGRTSSTISWTGFPFAIRCSSSRI